jgi:hypothetical protein
MKLNTFSTLTPLEIERLQSYSNVTDTKIFELRGNNIMPGANVRYKGGNFWSSSSKKVFTNLPQKGKIYTIRRIYPNINGPEPPVGIALDEIRGKWQFLVDKNGDLHLEEAHFSMENFELLSNNTVTFRNIIINFLKKLFTS